MTAMRYLFLLVLGIAIPLSWAQTTHVEETDPAVTYSGTWYTNNSTANTNSLANLTNTKDAMASITFNGTGITWISVRDPFSGVAWLYLDGKMIAIDTYGDSTQYQQPLYSVHGLPAGLHTLAIEVPHIRHLNGHGSWVWIDGFDIDGVAVTTGTSASAGRIQENDPALKYTGTWFPKSSPVFSGSGAMVAEDASSSVSLTFNGTSILWIAFKDPYSGIAKVILDGTLVSTVDLFQAAAQSGVPAFSSGQLASGQHTLTIQSTGTSSTSSSGVGVWMDSFQIVGSVLGSGPPTIAAGGVVNGASYNPAPNNQLSAGQIISIFGTNFLPSGRADAASLPLPTQLGSSNTTVNVCGKSIPLYSVFPGQINAQLPFECPATGSSTITVTSGGQTTASQNISLAPGSPGIFTVNTSGTGDGVILHADNSLVSATSPAKAGEQVVIYCTGLGPTNPAVVTGSAAAQNNHTTNPVTARIGGQNATVVYSGMSAGFAGLYQINVIVPGGLSGSQAVDVTVSSTNTSRAGVTIAVRP